MSDYVIVEATLYLSAKRLENGLWFVSAPGYSGVWGSGRTDEEAADECIEVWREWRRLA